MTWSLHHGDCIEWLRSLPDNSVDSCVSDPPYLIDFMGRDWDSSKVEQGGITPFQAWLAGFIAGEGCFRVHKQARGEKYACVFQIRLRADDKAVLHALRNRVGAGHLREEGERTNRQGVRSAPSTTKWIVSSRDDCLRLAQFLDGVPFFAKKQAEYDIWRRALTAWSTMERGNRWKGGGDFSVMGECYRQLKAIRSFQGHPDEPEISLTLDPFMPGPQWFHYQWLQEAFRVLKPGGHLVGFSSTRTVHHIAAAAESAGFELRDTVHWAYFSGFPKSRDIQRDIGADSILGVYYRGFGTALKPCIEPAVLVRKPLSESSIARNVLQWGTGALNIDATRFGLGAPEWVGPNEGSTTRPGNAFRGHVFGDGDREGLNGGHPGGRWPGNLFYCPKASRSERERGCDDLPPKAGHEAVSRKEGSAGTQNPRAGAGRTAAEIRNYHPTVKPVRLIRWLQRLVTPPGGVTIDPFTGSGTAGVAAVLEGFEFLGAELAPTPGFLDDYHAIASARIAHAQRFPSSWTDTQPGTPFGQKPDVEREAYERLGQMGLFQAEVA